MGGTSQQSEAQDLELSDWHRLPSEPTVSVCMITYQHAPFIRQSLDSVLMQQTDFPIEICLGEDQSTDGTREICQEYAAKHPEVIRLFLRDRFNPARTKYRAPFMHNFVRTLDACRGQYVAFLDGDDYWTHPLKLARQVQVLEDRRDAMICHHECFHLHEDISDRAKRIQPGPKHFPVEADIRYLIEHRIPSTPTCLIRRIDWGELFCLLKGALSEDRVMYPYLARLGPVILIRERMAVYRIHPGGISHAGSDAENLMRGIDSILYLVELSDRGVFAPELRECMVHYLERIVSDYIRPGGLELAQLTTVARRLDRHFETDNWVRVAHRVATKWGTDRQILCRSRAYRLAKLLSKLYRRFRGTTVRPFSFRE